MRIHYYRSPDGEVNGGYKLSTVKKLIKQNGGEGWTEHCERDGTLFEVTPIVVNGNNKMSYNVKYNRHL